MGVSNKFFTSQKVGVKVTFTSGDPPCFLKSMEDFERFNSVYQTYFEESPPARECVEVARLPKDVSVEVSAICGS